MCSKPAGGFRPSAGFLICLRSAAAFGALPGRLMKEGETCPEKTRY